MSKKLSIIISVVWFIALVALMACEVTHPTGGAAMIRALMH